MKTQHDKDELVRLGHMAEATQTPAEFTAETQWHGTITLVGSVANDSFVALDTASDAQIVDDSENTKARNNWVEKATKAAGYISWMANDAAARLTKIRPGEPEPPPDEMLDRKTIVEHLQSVTPTLLLKSRPTAAINALTKLGEQVGLTPSQWFSAADRADLNTHIENCQAAWKVLVAEALDDDKVMDDLQSARFRANQTLVAGRAILGGVLSLTGSSLTVDDVILKITHKKKDKAEEVATPTTTPAAQAQTGALSDALSDAPPGTLPGTPDLPNA